MSEQPSCPCGSGQNYAQCCGGYHRGERRAATAEALMRSRYAAYVRADSAYLLKTWHASTRPEQLVLSDQPAWQRLEILDCVAGQPGDTEGVVEFIAHYQSNQGPGSLRERSRFLYEQGAWFYLDGEVARSAQSNPAIRIGRNAPCPCGSGRKFKHCCGR